MESLNKFYGGMNKDTSPMFLKDSEYIDAEHMVVYDVQGNQFSLSNERGWSSIAILPPTYDVLGLYYIDRKIIIFSTDQNTLTSQVGYYDLETAAYTTVFDDSLGSMQTNMPAQKLNFSVNNPIQAQGRIAFNGDIYIYYTDNLNPPRWININRNAFDEPYGDLEAEMSFFPSPTTIGIDLLSILESGQLSAGGYQFAVRYTDLQGNTTQFSPISNLVPIVDNLVADGRDKYNGAGQEEQLGNKSIELRFTNLDQTYRYIQVAAIHFEGESYTPTVYITDPINFSGTTFDYIYSGIGQTSQTIALEELVQDFAIYDTAGYIAQKNNRLFLANLKQDTFNASLQQIANNVDITYKVEEILVDSNITGYKNELNTFEKKGYRRGEAYAFGIVFFFKNGSTSPVFHIPGPASGTATRDGSATDNNAFGTLGTTVATNSSSLTYPQDGNFPVGTVRFHKMPELSVEPHYRNDAGDVYIRILGIEVTNIDLSSLAFEQSNKIEGFMIVRAPRTKPENRSIISQGVYNRYIGWPSGAETNSVSVVQLNPLFGNTVLRRTGLYNSFTFYTGTTVAAYDSLKSYYEDDTTKSNIGWFSPDSELRTFTRQNEAQLIRQELEIVGTPNATSVGSTDLHVECDFNNHNGIGTDSASQAARTFAISRMEYTNGTSNFPNGGGKVNNNEGGVFNLPIFDGSTRMYNYENEGHWRIVLNDPLTRLPVNNTMTLLPGRSGIGCDITMENLTRSVTDLDTETRFLVNLINSPTNQYGELQSIFYVPVKAFPGEIPTSSDVYEIFGGDTYISKYYFKTSTKVQIFQYTTNRTGNEGFEFRALAGVWIESDINCDYRHQPVGGLPFFPNNTPITEDVTNPGARGVLDINPAFGHSNGYNQAYSIENDLRIYGGASVADLDTTNVHPTRIIFSDKLVEGQTSDFYRRFLVESFQDLPKNKGEITNLFEFNNRLFAHTKESLWQLFVEQQEQVNTQDGEDITIRAGGVLELPPIELFTQAGGYAGLQAPWAAVITPFGYVFPDASQGKVFLLSQGLEEISSLGMDSFFANNLFLTRQAPTDGNGHIGWYDNRLKRYVLGARYQDLAVSDFDFCVSFDMRLKKWVSRHSYFPAVALGFNDDVVSFKNIASDNNLYFHHSGTNRKFGIFEGEDPNPSTLTLSLNIAGPVEKVFDTIHWHSVAKDESLTNFPIVLKETFDTLQFYNEYQNTGITNLVISNPKLSTDNLVFRYNEYHHAIGRDRVIDPTTDILNSNNLYLTSQYRPRMSGKYIIAKLIYNNSDDYRLITDYVRYKTRRQF